MTYIDARKAYDTVWREGNYVRLFDLGVQGKMWRQIQAMGARLRSKVRLPFGETEWFDVRRGVAQGAAESPWLYSNFINGLAEKLKERGLGVMTGGMRTPLLMYADDIVMMASNMEELHKMNAVATQYAFENRFRHNGDKSAVMVFNASKELKGLVQEQRWVLSGERVEVKSEYKYLGVDVLSNSANWRTHMERVTRKARFRSNDLLWMCRGDQGIRPRSAVTLWKAIVRPILEYAAELWADEIPLDLIKKAEKVQTDFARGMLALTGKNAAANDFVRAELGLETLQARWRKLRLGYWRRVQVAHPARALSVVAKMRREQVVNMGALGRGSWMWGIRRLLQQADLAEHWYAPALTTEQCKSKWKDAVYEGVEEMHEAERRTRMQGLSSMVRYGRIKYWGKMDAARAQFTGEIGQRGALVCERYMDDIRERTGCHLKLLCRAGCLPVLGNIARERKWQQDWARCMMCGSGAVEDMPHLLLECEAYAEHRDRLIRKAGSALNSQNSREQQVQVLLGARLDNKDEEDNVDHAVKRFLKKAWRVRKALTGSLNEALGRSDFLGHKRNEVVQSNFNT